MNRAARMAMEDTFAEVKALVFAQVKEYKRRYPLLDYDEALSGAMFAYMDAYYKFRPEKGDFPKWVVFKVRMKIRKIIHLACRAQAEGPKSYDRWDEYPTPASEQTFNLEEFLAPLSGDAQQVVRYVINFPPIDVLVLLKEQTGTSNPVKFRTALKKFLRESDWSRDRITAAFDEVRLALSGESRGA